LGGLWQAVVFGFAGLTTLADGVSIAPQVLPAWKRLSFPLQWRGRTLRVHIEQDVVGVDTSGEEPLRLRLESGSEIVAEPGREYIAKKTEAGWEPWQMARSSSKGAL